MHMAPACLLLCRSNANWHSHRSTSELGSCAVGSGAAYALLHRSNRRMHHPRSQSPVHLTKPKIHKQRQIWYCCVVQYHASSMAAHLPHRQLFGKLLALPAPGRSPQNLIIITQQPKNSPEEHLPFNHTGVRSFLER